MRKIRKRVFAAVLATALFCTMPGMAFAAEAEEVQTEDISESVAEQENADGTEQTETDDIEDSEDQTEATQEPEAEDGDTDQPETGEDDAGDTETEEQEQSDISPCLELQEQLDEADIPAPIDEPTEGAVAVVDSASGITYYGDIDTAWTAAQGKTATVTLLADVTAGGTLTVDAGSTITLKGGDYTLTSGQGTAIQVNGTLKLESGTVKSTYSSSQAKGINVSGTLEMTGGAVTASTSTASGSEAVRADSGGNITVSGGSLSGVFGIWFAGGTATIQNGEISAQSRAIEVNTGTVTIEGGTFTGRYYGLNVGQNGTAVLRGGTFTGGNGGYAINSKTVLSGLLDKTQPGACYAYFENGKPVALADGQTSLDAGTYTVGVCNHEGSVRDNGNGTHGGDCPYCGKNFDAESHTLGAGNVCEGCGTPLKVKVEIGNATTYYGTINAAWEAVEGATSAEITLLDDVTTEFLWGPKSGQNITFNGGNFEYTSKQNLLNVTGHLTVNSGTFIATGGGNVALHVTPDGTATLNGGTFTGTGGSYWFAISSQQTPVSEFLGEGRAYFDANGQPIEMTGQTYLEGTVTVQECEHKGVTPTPNNDGTHSLKCPYCGYTEAAKSCTYGTGYQHDDTNHWQTCAVCGYQKTETHTLNLKQGDTVNGVTQNREACDCGFFNAFTVTVTVPSGLTYGNTGGKRVAYTVNPVKSGDAEWELTDMQGKVLKMEDDTLPANLPAGDYRLWIYGSNDSKYVFVGTTIFTVSPAPLTGGMVTLSSESVTYSGTEQKPTITVKQGETTLADRTAYDIIYSTTDFTNAGTIIVTITGKGNYKGTVEKTYTIKKAVLEADGTGIAKGTYGAKLSDLSVTGLTAVYQGDGAAVSGTWKLTGSTIPAVGDTGIYTAAFTPDTGAGNYEPLTAQVKLNIAQAEAPASPEGTLYVQNNRAQSYQYDLTQLLPALENGKSYGTVRYTLEESAVNISGGYYTDGAEITGTLLTLPIQKVEDNKEGNIGEVSITITSRNYKDMTATIAVRGVNSAPVTITGVSVAERAYNGNAIACTGTPKAVESDGHTAAINVNDYQYTWKTVDGTVLSGAPKDAGSYILTVSVDNGAYIGSSTISFVIDKASITITANSMTVNKGSAKPTLTYTISGLAEKEALAVEPTLTCNADMNTAGRYPITVSGAAVPDNNNYHTEITYIPGALTVTASTSGGSSGGGNGGGDRGNNDGNGSGSENNGDGGQGNSSDNGGGNTTPGVPALPTVTNTNPGTDTETAKPGTGNTARPGTGTKPGSSAAQEERPDTGIPFIKGEDGKIGWNVIRAEEEKAEEGSVINVDMNGTAVVPGDIFDSIKDRDITIIFDMGNGIIWRVDGKSVTTDRAEDIDFTVRTGGNAVPVEIVNHVAGEHYSIRLSLAHDGEFGFIAVLSVGIGEENAGYLASLYYYNEDTGELEFICADEVAQDGTVSFAFTHASDYVVVVDREAEEESGTEETAQSERQDEDSAGAAEDGPQIGQNGQPWRPWWFVVIGILAIVIGAGVFFVVKKKGDVESGM